MIFHHTAGHWHELDHQPSESYAEAAAYVRSIQNFHMDGRGWNDTGQNFTVCRNGLIFEGRHGSLAAVGRGKMVVSAHCPGQNENPGVEIEHNGNEPMTPAQYEAAVWLFAWICGKCEISPLRIKGHRDYYATACPGVLYTVLPQFRRDVATEIARQAGGDGQDPWYAKYGPKVKPKWVFDMLKEAQRRYGGKS